MRRGYRRDAGADVDALAGFLAGREAETTTGIGVNGWLTALYRSMRQNDDLQRQFLAQAAAPAETTAYRETRLAFNRPAWISAG
jgi:hypothetical protein